MELTASPGAEMQLPLLVFRWYPLAVNESEVCIA